MANKQMSQKPASLGRVHKLSKNEMLSSTVQNAGNSEEKIGNSKKQQRKNQMLITGLFRSGKCVLTYTATL